MLTFHLQVVGLRDVQQVVAVRDHEVVFLALLVDEGDVPLLAGSGGVEVSVPPYRARGERPYRSCRTV